MGSHVPALGTEEMWRKQEPQLWPQRAELGEQPTHPCSGPGKARLPPPCADLVRGSAEGGRWPSPTPDHVGFSSLFRPRQLCLLPGLRLACLALVSGPVGKPGPGLRARTGLRRKAALPETRLPWPFSCRACSTETEEKHAPVPKIRQVQTQKDSLYALHGVRPGPVAATWDGCRPLGPHCRTQFLAGSSGPSLQARHRSKGAAAGARPGQRLSQASWAPPTTCTETSTLLSRGSASPKRFSWGLSGVSENLPTEPQPTGRGSRWVTWSVF